MKVNQKIHLKYNDVTKRFTNVYEPRNCIEISLAYWCFV